MGSDPTGPATTAGPDLRQMRYIVKVAERGGFGMEHEGRLRHTLLLRDGWRDSEVFSILEPEWAGATG